MGEQKSSLEEAFIKSINIGTKENPITLLGEKAREWIQNKFK